MLRSGIREAGWFFASRASKGKGNAPLNGACYIEPISASLRKEHCVKVNFIYGEKEG